MRFLELFDDSPLNESIREQNIIVKDAILDFLLKHVIKTSKPFKGDSILPDSTRIPNVISPNPNIVEARVLKVFRKYKGQFGIEFRTIKDRNARLSDDYYQTYIFVGYGRDRAEIVLQYDEARTLDFNFNDVQIAKNLL